MITPLNSPRVTPISLPGTGGGGLNWRGAWTAAPIEPYMVDDLVKLETGASAGTYICVADNNPTNPGTGIGWVQIASGQGNGNWA